MPEVSQAVEDRFVDCNTDQVEGLTWDEVQQCEVKMMIKRMQHTFNSEKANKN